MRARVICRTGQSAGLTKTCGDVTRIGRAPSNEICIPVEGLSRLHSTITFAGGAYYLEDAGSTNGTFLNGRLVRKERLHHLDVISLGAGVDLIFQRREITSDASIPRIGIQTARLVALDGPEAGSIRDIPRGVLIVGRATACNLLLDNAAVSKMHARLERSADQVILIDLASSNGTFVNGVRTTTARLNDGDRIVFAAVREFRVELETGAYQSGVGGVPALDISAPMDETKRQIRDFSESWKLAYDFSPGENAPALKIVAATGRPEKVEPDAAPPRAKSKEQAPPPVQKAKKPAPAPPAQTPPSPPPSAPKPPAPAPPVPEPQASESPAPPRSVPAPPAPQPAAPRLAPPQPAPPAPAPPAEPAPIVEITLRGDSLVVQLPVGTHVVGREPGAPVYVPDPKVSRQHAILDVSRERVLVTDSGSANGTFVNDQRIAGPSVLKDGDSLAFGHVSFKVAIRRGP